jgi:hypothetical protein
MRLKAGYDNKTKTGVLTINIVSKSRGRKENLSPLVKIDGMPELF